MTTFQKAISIPLLAASFTAGTFLFPSAGITGSADEMQATSDMPVLIERSDTIVLATVEQLDQKLESTRVRMAVQKVFKGDPSIKHLELEHRGGKHTVDFTEPSFSSYDKAVLYLTKDGDIYHCTGGAGGKKTVVNDNVYLQPDNFFVSTTLKKYIAALETQIRKASSAT